MSKSLTVASSSGSSERSNGAYLATSMLLPRNGLQLPRNLPFDKWLTIGAQLSSLTTHSSWCLGDWLVYGIVAYSGRYRDAIEQTSLDYQTLRNYAWVAKRFPMSRRRDTLSFGHHAEVAALPEPEQDFWLRKAEEFGWSVKKLRREVRESQQERVTHDDEVQDTPDDRHPEGLVKLHIRVSPDQLESCNIAAKRAGMRIEEWITRALLHATRLDLSHIRESLVVAVIRF